MASTITFRVDGLRQLGERMRGLSNDVAIKFSGRATGKAAQLVKRADKQNLRSSPSIDSGLVEKNVIVKKLRKSQTQLTSEHIVTIKKVVYPKSGNEKRTRNTRQVGGYLEFGTVNMPAEPHLRPALDQNLQRATTAMADSLQADLAKAGQ